MADDINKYIRQEYRIDVSQVEDYVDSMGESGSYYASEETAWVPLFYYFVCVNDCGGDINCEHADFHYCKDFWMEIKLDTDHHIVDIKFSSQTVTSVPGGFIDEVIEKPWDFLTMIACRTLEEIKED